MTARYGLGLALLMASAGCDGFVRARVQVVSVQGEAIPDALLRLKGATDHDLARFTDARGCAYFSGVVAPVRHVSVTVTKSGYHSRELRLRTIKENCLVVRLAPESQGDGSLDTLGSDDCPCDSKAGYSPTMSARFKITTDDRVPIEHVTLLRSDRPRTPWSQVTDASGCLGVRWIVAADDHTIPLLLEKAEYQAAQVDVPTMQNRCYAVSLSRVGVARASAVVPIDTERCGCEMFSGGTVWPER